MKDRVDKAKGKLQEGAQESGESTAPTVTDVKALPDDLRELVARMLVEGATIEDVVEAVAEFDGPRVTPTVVRNFYRENPELQKQRVMRQLKAAEELKAKIRYPRPAGTALETDLTNAWLLTGLQFLNRHDLRFTLRDAVNARLRQENTELRRQIFAYEYQRDRRADKLRDARIRNEQERAELLRLKVVELQRAAERDGAQMQPDLMARIQDIYGLTQLPAASAAEDDSAKA